FAAQHPVNALARSNPERPARTVVDGVINMNPQGGAAQGRPSPNAGIDVSKQHLDVCWESTQQRLSNDAAGWSELIAKLTAAQVDLVVIEATGGYERGVLLALQQADIAVARVNPRQA